MDLMPLHYRKIRVPVPHDTLGYRAFNSQTGETLESTDLAALLRRIALSFAAGKSFELNWKLTTFAIGQWQET